MENIPKGNTTKSISLSSFNHPVKEFIWAIEEQTSETLPFTFSKLRIDSMSGTDIVRELPAQMGPYDGLCLKTGNQEYWMKSPDETALVPNDNLYTYLSSQGPIKMKLSNQAALKGPPVDGVKGSSEKMFMLANNVASPLCCPSTFSTSTGCLCTTKNQRDFIASRGYLDEKIDLVESVKKAEI